MKNKLLILLVAVYVSIVTGFTYFNWKTDRSTCFKCVHTMTSFGHGITIYNGQDSTMYEFELRDSLNIQRLNKMLNYDGLRRWDGKLKSRFKCKKVKR